jgi:hypothetical protein
MDHNASRVQAFVESGTARGFCAEDHHYIRCETAAGRALDSVDPVQIPQVIAGALWPIASPHIAILRREDDSAGAIPRTWGLCRRRIGSDEPASIGDAPHRMHQGEVGPIVRVRGDVLSRTVTSGKRMKQMVQVLIVASSDSGPPDHLGLVEPGVVFSAPTAERLRDPAKDRFRFAAGVAERQPDQFD